MLYGRLMVTMGIALYTSRVVLALLGEINYGIFNVVGGVVVLFSFITSSLTSSTQRFLNLHIEQSELQFVKKLFSTCTLAHIIISGFVLLLGETVGLWFVVNKLNIPQSREVAAMWVYQTTLLSTIFNVIVVPYRSSIIASEKMSIFATLSIVESILRLAIVFIIPILGTDYLIIYSILYAGVSIIIFVLYRGLANKHLNFCRFAFIWDRALFFDIISFSAWYLIGGVAMVGSKQGVNILLNIVFGVIVNAAAGIANQVRAAVYNFASSFQTAFNPQLVKLYGQGRKGELFLLINRASRFSFFLIYIVALPVAICCKEILHYWLTEVPAFTTSFTQLVLVSALFEALSVPLWTTIGATGKIKRYHLTVSLILLCAIPTTYLAFKLGYPPPIAYITVASIDCIAYLYRLFYLNSSGNLDIHIYWSKSMLPCIKVVGCTLPISLLIYFKCAFLRDSFWGVVLVCIFIVVITLLSIIGLGISKEEKHNIWSLVKSKIKCYE